MGLARFLGEYPLFWEYALDSVTLVLHILTISGIASGLNPAAVPLGA